jgi:hypothetical protein
LSHQLEKKKKELGEKNHNKKKCSATNTHQINFAGHQPEQFKKDIHLNRITFLSYDMLPQNQQW